MGQKESAHLAGLHHPGQLAAGDAQCGRLQQWHELRGCLPWQGSGLGLGAEEWAGGGPVAVLGGVTVPQVGAQGEPRAGGGGSQGQ